VERGKITIVGGGTAGTNAAKIAIGIGAKVTILDISLNRLAYLDDIFGGQITTLYSTDSNIARSVSEADLVIGSVLIPGAAAPKLIKSSYLSSMKPGSVIVDIAIDQGGCCESSHVTYHDAPTYKIDGIVHYCVGNMPGAVPRTSTFALANTTLMYGIKIADLGLEQACASDPNFALGLNTFSGECTNKEVAESLGLHYSKMFIA
jgi:alanine dehydrogenase